MIYTITGATGHLGSQIMKEARQSIDPKELRVAVRNLKKAEAYVEAGIDVRQGNYHDVDQMTKAYRNTDVLIHIPSITHPSIVRVPEFENAVQAAETAGVKHFLFVGFFADQEENPFHMSPFFGYANRRLAASRLDYTIIRNSMYADPLVPYLSELTETGRLPYPVEYGKISFISREDSAKAILKVAMDENLQGRKYTLTQNRNYTMTELAALLSDVSEKKIVSDPMTIEQFAETYDEPEGFGVVLASLYKAADRGFSEVVTGDYRNIMGEEAEGLESYIRKNQT